MSKKEKLIERLLNIPADLDYSELKNILKYVGYLEDNKGKTSGSRIRFYNKESNLFIDNT
ncbi:MAG: hypothetical protein PHD21_07055 [Flavobacteriales bacterium]|nr:hypothetical protein [Flavobacteriales bacterium]